MLKIIAILCVGFLLSIASYGETPTPPKASEHPTPQATNKQKKSDADERGTEKSPLVIKVLPSQNADEQPSKVAKEQEDNASPHWWLVWVTVLLALFTCALWVATYKLWRATERLVKGAENTAENQLRAYISIDGDKEPILNGPPGVLEIHMLMKNVGTTPSFKLNYWISAGVHPFPQVGELHRQEPDTNQHLYVPPGMQMELVVAVQTPWTREMLNTDIGDSMCLYVWGEVHYRDIFSKPHFVKFRFMRRPGENRPSLEYCQQGNDAD